MKRNPASHEEQAALLDEKVFVLRVELQKAAEQYRKLITPPANTKQDQGSVHPNEDPGEQHDSTALEAGETSAAFDSPGDCS